MFHPWLNGLIFVVCYIAPREPIQLAREFTRMAANQKYKSEIQSDALSLKTSFKLSGWSRYLRAAIGD